MNREELAAKVDWEGGVLEAITGYGLSVDRLPEDVPLVIREAWQRVYDIAADACLIEDWLESGSV